MKPNKFKEFKQLITDFTSQLEEVKKQQITALNDLESSQVKDSNKLNEVETKTELTSEVVSKLQEAVNFSNKQFQFRDEANQTLKEIISENREIISKLAENSRQQLERIFNDFNQRIEKLNAWQVLQAEQIEKEQAETKKKQRNFWLISVGAWIGSILMTALICYFVFKK